MKNFYGGGRGLCYLKRLSHLFKSNNNLSRTLFSFVISLICVLFSDAQAQSGRILQGVVRSAADGQVLEGVSIHTEKGGEKTSTDRGGKFSLRVSTDTGTLYMKHIGFAEQNLAYDKRTTLLAIALNPAENQIEEVEVVSTGYQTIPKERATGSFEVIDSEMINRSVSTNFQDRLRGMTTGIQWETNNSTIGRIQTNPNLKETGITIRGTSTFMASTEPLIVIDNFPYEGELSNINPNDIENITILRDAAAASIWGSRSGNGVIVITTKRGKKNERMTVEASANLTVAAKPDLFYNPRYLDAKAFIAIEQDLFNRGYFNSDIANVSTRPVVSPSVEIMALVRSGLISPEEGSSRLQELGQYDVRNDYQESVYQDAINQQYSASLRGGTDQVTYRMSAGWDDNKSELRRNGFNRIVLNALNTYNPVDRLSITVGLNYAQSKTSLNNDVPNYTISGSTKYTGGILPYTRLVDDDGSYLDVPHKYREQYLIETADRGYLDWRYRPLEEIDLADNGTKLNNVLARVGAKYEILPKFSAELNYQHEQQQISDRNHRPQDTYYVRDLINRFTVHNVSTNQLTYNYPLGGMLFTSNNVWQSSKFRGQLNYNKELDKHQINAIAGAEIIQLKTDGMSQTLIGYDDQFGTSVSGLNFNTAYPNSPAGSSRLPGIGGSISGILNRYNSLYANASYGYANKYIFSLSARRDGANLFGAKANDRFTPLWSAGMGWTISNEEFYRFDYLPYLKMRTSFGYNGNTYNRGTSLLTGRYLSEFTGAQKLVGLTAPNAQLRWERIKNFNVGLDFKSNGGVVSGFIEYYIKSGLDLVQPTVLAPQTGYATYSANTAQSKTSGLDINLSVRIFDRKIKWNTTALLSFISDEVVKYDVPYTSIRGRGGIVGRPMGAIFAYRWEGLNPETGAPVGMLNGESSENYSGINNNLNADELVYMGSQTPTRFGSWRNDFSYGRIHVSFNILYHLGYVFRRPSISTDLTAMLTSSKHADYFHRWQQPGDEATTSVPALVYPNNSARNTFYQYAEVLVTPGDHIRLQDLRIGCDLNNMVKLTGVKLNAFAYANNLGILWRKNDFDIDPDAIFSYRTPRTISFGLTANF